MLRFQTARPTAVLHDSFLSHNRVRPPNLKHCHCKCCFSHTPLSHHKPHTGAKQTATTFKLETGLHTPRGRSNRVASGILQYALAAQALRTLAIVQSVMILSAWAGPLAGSALSLHRNATALQQIAELTRRWDEALWAAQLRRYAIQERRSANLRKRSRPTLPRKTPAFLRRPQTGNYLKFTAVCTLVLSPYVALPSETCCGYSRQKSDHTDFKASDCRSSTLPSGATVMYLS